MKYSVVERPEKLDEIIFPEISSFLMLIKDGDRVSQIKVIPFDDNNIKHYHALHKNDICCVIITFFRSMVYAAC